MIHGQIFLIERWSSNLISINTTSNVIFFFKDLFNYLGRMGLIIKKAYGPFILKMTNIFSIIEGQSNNVQAKAIQFL